MRPPEQTSHDATPSIDGFIDSFENAWRAGREPKITEILKQASAHIVSDELRRALLHELISVDLEYRWKRSGGPKIVVDPFVAHPTLDHYAAAHPELGQVAGLPVELIAEEYRVRRHWGDMPDHAEFIGRFGERAGELAAALQRVDAELTHELDASEADSPFAAQSRRPRRLPEYDERAPLDYRDFTLQLHLGSGGIGKVYRARQRSLNRPVAVKMLKKQWLQFPAAVEHFLQEAKTVAGLRHPNIVGVHGLGRTPRGGYFIVMEWIDGRNLAEVLAAGDVRVSDAVDWVAEAADALAYAHRSGVIHCDLKPSNLLLDRAGKLFVTDFGFALPLDNVRDSRFTGGTFGYLAPEQLDDDARRLTPAIDVYGLGAVLYTLLVGRLPAGGLSRYDLAADGSSARSASLRAARPEISPELESVCLRCLASEPNRRFASTEELATALRTVGANWQRP